MLFLYIYYDYLQQYLYTKYLLILLEMLYQKTLKQLNAIFPKLRIAPPIQKITVRPLIHEVEVSVLTNHDYSMLRNPETAPKILTKIHKMIETYLNILENNQAARQQQQKKPLSMKALDQYRQIYGQCIHINCKSEFLSFIQKVCPKIYSDKPIYTPSLKDYKQVLICNSIQYYNTITQIDQDQYFISLEQLNENLNILLQLSQTAHQNPNDLQEFYDIMQKYQVFKKKDNPLTRVIHYNLLRTSSLSNDIETLKKNIYKYQQNLTFSICRCYYICFLAREDIIEYKQNQQALLQIKKHLCDRQEKVFPKLYNRKIKKCLILLDLIDNQIKFQVYDREALQIKKAKKDRQKILQKFMNLKNKFRTLQKPIKEEDFLNTFFQIQSLLLEVQDQQMEQIRNQLTTFQHDAVKAFALPDGNPKTRKFVTTINPKLPNQYNQEVMSSHRQSQMESSNRLADDRNSDAAYFGDATEDIFLNIDPQPNYSDPKTKQILTQLETDSNNLNQFCKDILEELNPQKLQEFEDYRNFDIEQIKILLYHGKKVNADFNELRILQMVMKSLLRPEITEQRFHNIFFPSFHPLSLKILNQKFVEQRYKLTKLINSSTFAQLPQNIRECITHRQVILKSVLRQLDSLLVISQTIMKLRKMNSYNICSPQTYYTFLKILLASKQIKLYKLSFDDQKEVPKSVKMMLDQKLCSPFLGYLDNYFPKINHKSPNLLEMLEYIQFFVDYKMQTDQLIKQYTDTIEQQDQNHEYLLNNLLRILNKWKDSSEFRLKQPYLFFKYHQALEQNNKINQVNKIVNHQTKISQYNQLQKLAYVLNK